MSPEFETENTSVGVIVAMDSELQSLLNEFCEYNEVEWNNFTFYIGTIGKRSVVATKSGIGKVNAAMGALTMIDLFNPEAIINTGIAGGTGNGANILDVVIADKVGYHDVWCGPGNALGQVQGMPELFECDREYFEIDNHKFSTVQGKVLTGLIASGDKFISTPDDLAAVLAVQPQAIACDMESGAIAQVCHLKKIPFIAIRVVSDTPGAADHLEQYADFWTKAPQSTFSILRELL